MAGADCVELALGVEQPGCDQTKGFESGRDVLFTSASVLSVFYETPTKVSQEGQRVFCTRDESRWLVMLKKVGRGREKAGG